MSSSLRISFPEPGIALLSIERPALRNALDRATMAALDQALRDLAARDDLYSLILQGSGGHFISGGDLIDLHGDSTEAAGRAQHDLMAGALDRLAALPCPVIAAMEGATRGGGMEVALACDLRIAASDASFAFAQINMAVTPGWGGAERLLRLIGYAHALDLLATGRVFTSSEAYSLGLLDRVCEPGQALDSALELARLFCQQAPLALRGVKAVLIAARDQDTAAARAIEAQTFARLWASADHLEATAAFLEKRPPHFQGK